MSQKEAEEFATRYTDVVAVSPSNSGISATVFKGVSGLTVAILGTEGINANDLSADSDIKFAGAAYGQIVPPPRTA
jgi:hypothetical protein